ncbi:hypothetical protein C7974DRAFT_395318 [Boeremia exigua]|uniref:uncharacterized protein n=1 Tax=Boeremia exigua TaxID=749465 RepID=UPI001E8CBD6B|nr:uncharacterized protein C7974DRAFT_395318 [Boeremia exigua]KAH6629833.1 hypothetical protein C7974DRAFT_395318 [Boeremia exigua]
MPINSKRPAAEQAGPTSPKKPRATDAKDMNDDDKYESVQISTELHDKFERYPKTLRHIVEEAYVTDVYDIIEEFKAGRYPPRQSKYHIVRAARTQGGDKTDYKLAQLEVFPNTSMANVAVLEQFRKFAPSKTSKFVKAPEVDLANPQFAALHSVPPGQMGWGFDSFGCISLHLTVLQENKLKHFSIYVERKAVIAVKAEADDDCLIVDNPNTV